MRSFTFAAISSVILFASCNGSTTSTTTTETTTVTEEVKQPVASKLDEAGTKMLTDLLADYYALKDAFVASSSADAATAAAKLKTGVDQFSTYLAKDTALYTSVKPQLDTMAMTTTAIAAEKADVEKQRIPFEKVSDNMYALLRNTELKNARVYQEFCPMAMNDKGAHWLSSEEEIKNPYFGKKMLECGEVTDSLK